MTKNLTETHTADPYMLMTYFPGMVVRTFPVMEDRAWRILGSFLAAHLDPPDLVLFTLDKL